MAVMSDLEAQRRAEDRLIEYATVTAERDRRVEEAFAAGLSKWRIHKLTGISRTKLDTILGTVPRGSKARDLPR
jgi:hypothetical protein